MAKIKNDYFKLIEQQVEYSVKASEMLAHIVENYSLDDILSHRQSIHTIEHTADELHHDILTKLSAEFITPIDQEDILGLVQIVDDITDALDEVVLDCYMYRVSKLPEYASQMSKIVCKCVLALLEAVKELKNFKKPAQLRTYLVDLNSIENESDIVYCEAIHSLFGSTDDCKTLIAHKAIYESFESCCDLCEHAADVIEQIIIKNT